LNKIPQKSSRDYGYRYGYRSYFGQQYTSENGLVYAPSSNELARLEREDFFNSMNKKKGRA
jgi:hypothetical protein